MKRMTILLAFAVSLLAACNNQGGGTAEMENTDLVPAGTYVGVAAQVDPEEKEVYMTTEDDQLLELYFSDNTELTRNGQSVSFDELEQGQRVEVRVEREGDHMKPLSVRILDESS